MLLMMKITLYIFEFILSCFSFNLILFKIRNMEQINLRKDQIRLETNQQLNNAVQPLLTDLYQLSMAYAYWKNKKKEQTAVFDLFFRKNPFSGEFTIFAGLEECLKYIADFRFSQSDIDYLKSAMPEYVEDEFYQYLMNMDLKDLKLYAVREGSLIFPRIPIMRLEGPLLIVQLLETTLLVLINYASLVATNAARFRLAAGDQKSLLEFGLRRAQGPDGGLSASKYCYIGGFNGTSNVLAGKLYGIPIKGTLAHSFVSSFSSMDELKEKV
jgi:nicotinate phosphoribosyltransferase